MDQDEELVRLCRGRVGRALGTSWRVDALVGIGGLGAVYAGSHRNGLLAAIKVLHPAVAATSEAQSAFPREMVLAGKGGHPGIATVLGEESDPQTGAFMIVELLRGDPLDVRAGAEGGRLAPALVLSIADQLLATLESAHASGLVHRDLRPRKLFLTSKGALKVLDLGLGALREAIEPRAQLRRERAAFFAPEQALGRWAEVDARTDLWAVGATIFTLLSGQRVHEGDTVAELLTSTGTRAARSLGRLRPDLPPSLIRIVDCALEREKARRFSSAAVMRAELVRAREVLGSPASPREAPSSRRAPILPAPSSRHAPVTEIAPPIESGRATERTSTLRPPPTSAGRVPTLASPRVPSFDSAGRTLRTEPARPFVPRPPPPVLERETAPTLAPPAPPPARTEPPPSTRGRAPEPPASPRELPTLVPPAPRDAPIEAEPISTRGWVPEPPSTRGWIPEPPSSRRGRPPEPPPSSRLPVPTAPSSLLPPPSSRRLLDAASSARAGQEAFFATKELFAHLQGIFTGSTQHGARHPEVVRYIERTFQSVSAALQRFPRGLVFQVTPRSFEAGGRASWEPLAPFDDLPHRLFSSGIRAIGLLPGLTLLELKALLRVLTFEPSRTGGPEDDLATLLWDADLPQVAIHRIDPFLAGSADTQSRLSRERRALLADHGASAEALLRSPRRAHLPTARLRMILKALSSEGEALDGLDALRLDEPSRRAARAELEQGAPALTDRLSIAAVAAYRQAVRRGVTESVTAPLRASITSIAATTPAPALQLAARLCAAIDDPPGPANAALQSALASAVVAPEALRQILAGVASAPDRLDAHQRLGTVLQSLSGAHFFAAFEALIAATDRGLREVLLPYVGRVAAGHEAAIGVNLPRVGEELGIELTRILGALPTNAAREALGNATRSPYPRVRIEALCHAEGLDGERLGVALDGLLGDPEPSVRMGALEAIARNQVASAEAPLLTRIRASTFDELPIAERRQMLASLAAVAQPRAEALAIDLLGDSRLIASPPHEQTREIAADLLGRLASSKEALFALTTASKKRWGTAEAVRAASLRAIDQICGRAGRDQEPSKS